MAHIESEATTPDKNKSTWAKDVSNYVSHLGKTSFALLYIVNGIAIGLTAFGYVHPPYALASIFGAISIAFAVVSLSVLVNSGVKYQAASNKKRK